MFVWIVLLLVSLGAAIFEKNHFINERPAIVFAEITEVKSEPQKGSPATFILHEGTKVSVTDSLESWRKIKIANGSEGWVTASSLRMLN